MKPMGFRVSGSIETKNIQQSIPPVDFQHVLVEGATGSGKTASLILPTFEDRLRRGHTIIFFDHKGHEHKKVKALAKKFGRLGDVVELGKPHSGYINLLAELDVIRLKEMIRETTGSKDPYWSNSAASLIEDIVTPLRKMYTLLNVLTEESVALPIINNIRDDLKTIEIDIESKPSFQTLTKIVASPKALKKYNEVITDISEKLRSALNSGHLYKEDEVGCKRQMLAKLISFENSIKVSSRFILSEDKSDTNTGNNAVLQILDNAIASYAKKDYMNVDEFTIADLIDSNAIIVIDTQSFGDDVMKLFFESMLQKSVMRLRTGTASPTSVFIDEANRVLFPSLDLHSDILREASVELVIAIQNEEQMISKFTGTVWDSIKGNIKHQFFIDHDHNMRYNNNNLMHIAPLLLEQETLMAADYAFHALKKNQVNLQKNFLGDKDMLPEKFTVIYDLDRFEYEASIFIEDIYGEQSSLSYYGETIVSKAMETYPDKKEEPEDFGYDESFTYHSLEDPYEDWYDALGLLDEEEGDDIDYIDIDEVEF